MKTPLDRAFVALALAVLFAVGSPGLSAAQDNKVGSGDDPVVAEVNGQQLRLSDLVAAKRRLPQQYRDQPLRALYAPLLQQLVERTLLFQAAEKAKLSDEPEVRKLLARERRRVLGDAWLSRQIGAKVTEDRLRARYNAEAKGQKGPEEIHARHILVKTEAEAREIAKLANRGGDFAALAKERSTGPSGAQGGDLGFFKKGDMVPAFEQTAFALQAGEISEPVKTQFGWHVIKVEERRSGQGPSFEDRRRELENVVTQQVIQESLAGLKKSADFKMFDQQGKEIRLGQGGAGAEKSPAGEKQKQ